MTIALCIVYGDETVRGNMVLVRFGSYPHRVAFKVKHSYFLSHVAVNLVVKQSTVRLAKKMSMAVNTLTIVF